MYNDIRDEWRLNDIENKLQQKADSSELYSIRNALNQLECEVKELRAENNEFRNVISRQENEIIGVQGCIEEKS